MSQLQPLAMPVGRVLIALIFVMFGMSKIFDYGMFAGYMNAFGVPGALLPLVIIAEVIGGIAIIVGWQTRRMALALAGFSILSALLFHSDLANQAEMTNFMKNVAIAGGFLFLFANGPGAYSLDNRKAG